MECPNGELPLYWAIRRGEFLIVESLIEGGANVDAKDSEGNPLLYHAIVHPRGLNVVESLIEGGVDVDAKDNEGNPLLYHAIIHEGGYNLVRYLIRGGADVNAKDAEGNSLLRIAIEKDDLNIIRTLIDAGATE